MSNLELIFAGATEMVPGSHFVLKHGNKHYGIDLGGVPKHNTPLLEKVSHIYPLAPDISAFIITHGHFDHIGKLERMVYKYGYRGPIFATEETHDIISAVSSKKKPYLDCIDKYNQITKQIQENNIDCSTGYDANEFIRLMPTNPDFFDEFIRLNEDERRKNVNYWKQFVTPEINSINDLAVNVSFASDALAPLASKKITLDEHMSLQMIPSSHILGSAQLILKHKLSREDKVRILFTGDLGYESDLFEKPKHVNRLDHMILDGTNCSKTIDKSHREIRTQIAEIINETYERRGQVYFGSFALNRMQEIMNHIKHLYKDELIPKNMRYIFNSVTGSKMLSIYDKHSDNLKKESWIKELEPFERIGKSADRSRMSVKYDGPAVILSASGMFSQGRIIDYLTKCNREKSNNKGIEDPRNSVVLCGYQAEETGQTLEQSMLDGSVNKVNIEGLEYTIGAKIHRLDISGHADKNLLLNYIQLAQPINLYLVHGEKENLHEFREFILDNKSDYPVKNVIIPKLYDSFRII